MQGIADFIAYLDSVGGTHSYMILRHGKVISEGWWAPFTPGMPHSMFSISKTFTSTAVGLAIAEGRFGLDDLVVELLADYAPANPGANLAAMRVRDLLTMTTGHDTDTAFRVKGDYDWIRTFLSFDVEHEPGTHFAYNTLATYALAVILTQTTGERLLDYLQPRLFEPLGITSATWDQSPQGIDAGGFGLAITTEDLARMGQLYLQRGEWNGQQLVPAEWIDTATSRLVDSNTPDSAPDWSVGYGYQIWQGRQNTYRGDGAFGQFMVVLPEHDAVLLLTSGLRDGQATLEAAWDILVPAFAAGADEGEQAVIPPLALPTQEGSATGRSFEARFAGEGIREARLDGATLTLVDEKGEHRIEFGFERWLTGRTSFDQVEELPIATSAAWTDENTWVGLVWFVSTPFRYRIELALDGDSVTLDISRNLGMVPDQVAHLTGTLG